ncbi:TPA: mechanosensitive ion channel, partial [Candidatus Bipolaricaulota bacterium]|nr:mechanosensitive ion channel [Candidatus Bipolaricaulota bacterium]
EDLRLGFRIKTGSVEGIVEKIDLRKIRIRDDHGQLHVLPNRAVEGAPWVVVSPAPGGEGEG